MNAKELSEDMFRQATEEVRGARRALEEYFHDTSMFRNQHRLCHVQERMNLGEELFLRADQLRIALEREKK